MSWGNPYVMPASGYVGTNVQPNSMGGTNNHIDQFTLAATAVNFAQVNQQQQQFQQMQQIQHMQQFQQQPFSQQSRPIQSQFAASHAGNQSQYQQLPYSASWPPIDDGVVQSGKQDSSEPADNAVEPPEMLSNNSHQKDATEQSGELFNYGEANTTQSNGLRPIGAGWPLSRSERLSRNRVRTKLNKCPICKDRISLDDWVLHATSHALPAEKGNVADHADSHSVKPAELSYLFIQDIIKRGKDEPELIQEFSCELCAANGLFFEEILSHIQEPQHLHEIYRWISLPSSPGHERYKEHLPEIPIKNRHLKYHFCEICFQLIGHTEDSVSKHVSGKQHVKSVRKTRENIAWVERGIAIREERSPHNKNARLPALHTSAKISQGQPPKNNAKPYHPQHPERHSSATPSSQRQQTKQSIQQPKPSTQQPKQSTRQSKQSTQQPKQSMQQPKQSTQQPKQSMQQPKQFMQQPKQSMQQPKQFMQQPKQSMQQPKHSTRPDDLELVQYPSYQRPNIPQQPFNSQQNFSRPGNETSPRHDSFSQHSTRLPLPQQQPMFNDGDGASQRASGYEGLHREGNVTSSQYQGDLRKSNFNQGGMNASSQGMNRGAMLSPHHMQSNNYNQGQFNDSRPGVDSRPGGGHQLPVDESALSKADLFNRTQQPNRAVLPPPVQRVSNSDSQSVAVRNRNKLQEIVHSIRSTSAVANEGLPAPQSSSFSSDSKSARSKSAVLAMLKTPVSKSVYKEQPLRYTKTRLPELFPVERNEFGREYSPYSRSYSAVDERSRYPSYGISSPDRSASQEVCQNRFSPISDRSHMPLLSEYGRSERSITEGFQSKERSYSSSRKPGHYIETSNKIVKRSQILEEKPQQRRLIPRILDTKAREILTKRIEATWQKYYHKYYSCVATNPEIVLEMQKEYLRSYRDFFEEDPHFELYYVKVAKPEDLREGLTLRIDRGSPGPVPNNQKETTSQPISKGLVGRSSPDRYKIPTHDAKLMQAKSPRSISPRRRSPLRRSQSPDGSHSLHRPRSPQRFRKRSRSPRRRSKSPRKRLHGRSQSPLRRSRSSPRRSRSPHRKLRSPNRKFRSPHRKSRSPHRKSRSPHRKSRSPHRKSRSPHRHSKSSLGRSQRRIPQSPKRKPSSPHKEHSHKATSHRRSSSADVVEIQRIPSGSAQQPLSQDTIVESQKSVKQAEAISTRPKVVSTQKKIVSTQPKAITTQLGTTSTLSEKISAKAKLTQPSTVTWLSTVTKPSIVSSLPSIQNTGNKFHEDVNEIAKQLLDSANRIKNAQKVSTSFSSRISAAPTVTRVQGSNITRNTVSNSNLVHVKMQSLDNVQDTRPNVKKNNITVLSETEPKDVADVHKSLNTINDKQVGNIGGIFPENESKISHKIQHPVKKILPSHEDRFQARNELIGSRNEFIGSRSENDPLITSTTQGFPVDRQRIEANLENSKSKSVLGRLGPRRIADGARIADGTEASKSGERSKVRPLLDARQERYGRHQYSATHESEHKLDGRRPISSRLGPTSSRLNSSDTVIEEMFSNPFLGFVHKTLTGIILIGQYQKAMATSTEPEDLLTKIEQEQKGMHSRMLTEDGHLLIQLARCCLDDPSSIEKVFPNVSKDIGPILRNLDKKVVTLIADTPIIVP